MAKKPKICIESETSQVRNGDAAANGQEIAATRPKSTRKRSPRTAEAKSKKTKPQLRDDDVRTRAYFISETRMRLSLPGDAQSDWLEARRQLLEELGGT